MTLEELYQNINGDYDKAIRVMCLEKLVDKHIRKFPGNGVAERLFTAAEKADATELFEAAHAMKGICANLGLDGLSEAASEIAEEFRPGNIRQLSYDEVKAKIQTIREIYGSTVEVIRKYEGSQLL